MEQYSSPDFFQRLKKISTLVFDVDGVLTNGTVLASENGELLRTFNIKDGYALQLAARKGYRLCIISGGQGEAMKKRLNNLRIKDVYLGVQHKPQVFQEFITANRLSTDEVLYMGDDVPDLALLKMVGLATCPADAVNEVKSVCNYISPKNGGEAAVRDVIEKVLKAQNNWNEDFPSAAESSL